MNNLKVAGSFSGTGGIELGFQQAGYDIVWSNEIDTHAHQTYTANFGANHLEARSIWDVNPASIPDHDIFVGGFPCQAFSHAGNKLGMDEDRGILFMAVARILTAKKPSAFLLENVKGLEGHDKGNTLKVILDTLRGIGYTVEYRVMSAHEYGNVPQGRERIYIVGFRDPSYAIEWPKRTPLTATVQDMLEPTPPAKYFYDERYGETTKKILAAVTDDAVYSYRSYGGSYVRRNESGVCPTLMANMGSGGHNVPIILDPETRIPRRLTPRECFNLQGYPGDFVLPEMADGHLYKQAGNAVAVPVVKRIAEAIADVLAVSTALPRAA